MNSEALIENINLKGYQVVESRMFRRTNLPYMCLFPNAISFNKECHLAMNNCENIQLMVNLETRTVLVKSCTSSDDNAILWERGTKNTYIPRFSCEDLTKLLFSVWKLDRSYHYKADGRLVKADSKLMLLFDFKDYETYDGPKRISHTAQ